MPEPQSGSSMPQLVIQYRLEAGCLGPNGSDFVEDFCFYAYDILYAESDEILRWEIIPRYDKKLAEFEYRLNDKTLKRDQATRYLNAFHKSLAELEDTFDDKLSELIDSFTSQFS